MQKKKIDYAHCPMRKFWKPSLGCLDRTMWESLRYPEKDALSAGFPLKRYSVAALLRFLSATLNICHYALLIYQYTLIVAATLAVKLQQTTASAG